RPLLRQSWAGAGKERGSQAQLAALPAGSPGEENNWLAFGGVDQPTAKQGALAADRRAKSRMSRKCPEAVCRFLMASHWLRTGPNGLADPSTRMNRAPRISAQRLRRDR